MEHPTPKKQNTYSFKVQMEHSLEFIKKIKEKQSHKTKLNLKYSTLYSACYLTIVNLTRNQ